jgi:hypothetical protein
MVTTAPVVPVTRRPDAPSGSDGEGPATEIRPGTRWLLRTFVTLTLLAVVTLLGFPARAQHDFAWSIRMEQTAAFLGAAYGAGAVLSLLALRRSSWREIRIPVLTVGVFAALTLVATLIHTHRLHLADGGLVGRFAAWFWLAVYLVVPIACLAVIVRQERAHRGPAPAVRRPLPRWLRLLLAAQGTAMFAAGGVLFVGGLAVHHHAEAMTRFWPWDLMPLSSMVIGAWLVSFGVAAALVIRERDLSRLLMPSVAYTAFGVLQLVVVTRYRTQIDENDPWVWAYLALLVAAVLTGGYGWWAASDPWVAPAPARLAVPARSGPSATSPSEIVAPAPRHDAASPCVRPGGSAAGGAVRGAAQADPAGECPVTLQPGRRWSPTRTPRRGRRAPRSAGPGR